MKTLLIIVFFYYSLFSNDYFKYCQECHGNSPNKYKLSFEQITIDFSKKEFISYLKYEKNKSSVHNTIIENNNTNKKLKIKLKKLSKLSFTKRTNITEFIFKKFDNPQCIW